MVINIIDGVAGLPRIHKLRHVYLPMIGGMSQVHLPHHRPLNPHTQTLIVFHHPFPRSLPADYCVAYAILFMISVENPPRG